MQNYKHELAEIQQGLREAAQRDMHPLRVYRPMASQLPIHESRASEVIVKGGRRSGKTLAVASEFASRILGIPITRADGTTVPLRHKPATKKFPKLYWVIGFDVKHIGQTLYNRLFSPGLGDGYRIIQNPDGTWRAYNTNTDADRLEESVLSPPLIPEYMIEPGSWHMDSAAGNIFHSVRLTNGATICAYASTGDHAKMGDAVHGIWIDEDIASDAFLPEWQSRLMSVRGWLMWSVFPQVVNEALIDTMNRAQEHEGEDDPPIQLFELHASRNEYADIKGLREGFLRAKSDDEVAHWDRGDIEGFLGNIRMYDFTPAIHALNRKEEREFGDATGLLEILLKRDGRFPLDWTRYLGIDPSHTRTACVFGVVPPPDCEKVRMGHRLIIENELVVKRHTPAMFADALRPLVEGLRFEAFVMDQQIGKQTTVGNDRTVFQSYEREFARIGLYSRISKHGFLRGSKERAMRRRTVRTMLEPVHDGIPTLLFVDNKTWWTQKEFSSYRKKQHKNSGSGEPIILDEPANEAKHDVMQALEYLSQFVWERMEQYEAWHAPEESKPKPSGAWLAAQAINKKQNSSYVHLGPGAAA